MNQKHTYYDRLSRANDRFFTFLPQTNSPNLIQNIQPNPNRKAPRNRKENPPFPTTATHQPREQSQNLAKEETATRKATSPKTKKPETPIKTNFLSFLKPPATAKTKETKQRKKAK